MRQARTKSVDPAVQRKIGEQAQARTLLLVLVCLFLGLAAGTYWYYRATNRNLTTVGETGSSLSESTKAVLKTNRNLTAVGEARSSLSESTTQTNAVVVEEIRRMIPNFDTVSLSEGKELLHAATMKELSETDEETQRRLQEAIQRVVEVQSRDGSVEEFQAAAKQLKQAHNDRPEKHKQVLARGEAQIQVWEQIKSK